LFWCDDGCFLEASADYDESEASISGRTFDVSLHENDFSHRNRVHSWDFRTVDLSLPAKNDGSRQIETSLPSPPPSVRRAKNRCPATIRAMTATNAY